MNTPDTKSLFDHDAGVAAARLDIWIRASAASASSTEVSTPDRTL